MKVLGWRKLSAWFLVYALVTASTMLQLDISVNGVEVVKWVTGFFFGANVFEHVGPTVKGIVSRGLAK